MALHNIFEPLIRRVGPGRYARHLAQMKVQKGGRRYVFRLRPGIRFHDRRPLTSADVRYTLELVSGDKSPSSLLRIELMDIKQIDDPNPLTVVIELRRPNYLLPAVLAEVGILPAHLYKRHGIHSTRLNSHPVDSGPYVRVSAPKDRIVLERHDDYWGVRPSLAEVVFRRIADPAAALAAIKNGEVDLLPDLYPGYYPEQVDQPRLKRRLRLIKLHPYRLRVVLYNHRRRVVRRPGVRKALAHIIDRQQLLRQVRHDLGRVLSAPLWPLGGGYDRSLHPRGYDRHRAIRLLEAAGWILADKAKVRERLGHRLQISLLRSRRGPDGPFLDTLRAEARAAGIALRVEPADFGFLRAQVERGRFDMAAFGIALQPGADLTPLLHSEGALNFGRYESTIVDGLLDGIRSTADAETRTRLSRRMHRALYEDPPLLVLYAPQELMVVNRRVAGISNDGLWPRLSQLGLIDAN